MIVYLFHFHIVTFIMKCYVVCCCLRLIPECFYLWSFWIVNEWCDARKYHTMHNRNRYYFTHFNVSVENVQNKWKSIFNYLISILWFVIVVGLYIYSKTHSWILFNHLLHSMRKTISLRLQRNFAFSAFTQFIWMKAPNHRMFECVITKCACLPAHYTIVVAKINIINSTLDCTAE